MRSLTWGCGQEEDPAGSPGGRRIQRCLCEGRRVRGSAGTPRAIRAGGGSSSRSRRKERARGGEPGRRIQQSLSRREEGAGKPDSLCAWLAAGSAGRRRGVGGIPRLSPCPPQGSGRDPAGRREELGAGGRRGAGQPRRRRVPGEPQQRLGQGRSVRRGAEGEGGGTQRLSPSLPLALASSARSAGGAGLSAAGPVPRSSAPPPPLPPVPPWGAEEPLPPLPPPRPFCR